MTDRVFAIEGEWALASDGVQWMLMRQRAAPVPGRGLFRLQQGRARAVHARKGRRSRDGSFARRATRELRTMETRCNGPPGRFAACFGRRGLS